MEFVQEDARVKKDSSGDQEEEEVEGSRRSETTNFFPNNSSCSRSTLMDLSAVEREHMFDKVVTPSDVGKLNRLVIPKQHAEKYFPLDSSATDKGLLLNFEDRNGKPWRFRYSYWNSSQSYVMTKGWSRFVKDKKLDAGDIVSFHRAKDRLFIDWRRRPQTPLNSLHHFRWGAARLFSLPPLHQPLMPPPLPLPPPPPQLSYNYNYQSYNNAPHPLQPHHHRQIGYSHHHDLQNHQYVMNLGSEPVYYLRSSSSSAFPVQQSRHVIDSVPLLHGRSAAAGKRLRLFGVNMECEMTNEDKDGQLAERVVLPSTALLPHVSAPPQLSEKGKSSLSFDLDL